MVTRHGFSCIQPSATSLSSVLFVQEPALQLLLYIYIHIYSARDPYVLTSRVNLTAIFNQVIIGFVGRKNRI
jgi:hypothetical protein